MMSACQETIEAYQCGNCKAYMLSNHKFLIHFEDCRKKHSFEVTVRESIVEIESECNDSSSTGSIIPIIFLPTQVVLKRLSSTEVQNLAGKTSLPRSIAPKKSKGDNSSIHVENIPEEDANENNRTQRKSSVIARKRKVASIPKEMGSGQQNEDYLSDVLYEDNITKDLYDDLLSGGDENVCTQTSSKRRGKREKNNTKISDDIFAFNCSGCTAYYRSELDLQAHIKAVHENVKNKELFTCPICYRIFSTRLLFQGHLRRHEDAEAVEESFNLRKGWPSSEFAKGRMGFSCKYCTMPHYSQHSFMSHMKSKHADKGKFCKWDCSYCPMGDFGSIKLFVVHIRNDHRQLYHGNIMRDELTTIHSSIGGRPKAQCDICNKMVDMYHLKAHKSRVHKNLTLDSTVVGTTKSSKSQSDDSMYNCPMENCFSRFKNTTLLKSHFILHLENNPYVCKVPGCGVRCDAQCHLDRHMKIHTGEQEVLCSKCGLTLSRKDKLLTHKCEKKQGATNTFNGGVRSRFGHLRLERIRTVEEQKDEAASNKYESDVRTRRTRININEIFETDPVFTSTCEKYPEFKTLILGNRPISKSRRTITPNPKHFRCLNCNTYFNIQKSLQKHHTSCTETKSAKLEKNAKTAGEILNGQVNVMLGCEICGDYFNNENDLKDHMKGVHGSKCTECGKQLSNSMSLARHWRLVHEKIMPSFTSQNKSKQKNDRNKKKKVLGRTKGKRKRVQKAQRKTKVENDLRDWSEENPVEIKVKLEPELNINSDTEYADFELNTDELDPLLLKFEREHDEKNTNSDEDRIMNDDG